MSEKRYPDLFAETIADISKWVREVTRTRDEDIGNADQQNQKIETLEGAEVLDSDIVFSDITTGNFGTAKHGFVPKGTNVGSYLKDDGTWAAVSNPPAFNSIAGFLPSSIAGTSTTASFTLSAGQAADSTNAAYITKSNTTSWAASNGNAINGTDAGSSTLANSTTYHIFACSGGSGTGCFVSASLTPTLPTGYTTYKRRVGSFTTDGAGAPLPYTAIESSGGGVINWLTTQVLDISTTTLGTSQTLYALSVPTGVKVRPLGTWVCGTVSQAIIVLSPDQTDVAPSGLNGITSPLPNLNQGAAGGFVYAPLYLTTNTSAQIGARATAVSTHFYGETYGWEDFRRS